MKFKNVVGIDGSKLSLSVFLYQTKDYKEFSNCKEGYDQLLKWLSKKGCNLPETLVCFEHTGLYSLLLSVFLTEKEISFSMISGLEVKRSLGISRDKNDEVDARKIAEYAHLRKDNIKLYTLPSKSILSLKPLLSLRERMVSQKAGYQATLKENKRIFNEKENKVLFKTLDKLLVSLEEEIKKVENEMLSIIKEDKELSRLYTLVTSIKGVGLVLGITVLVYTNCFSSFDCWRNLLAIPELHHLNTNQERVLKAKTR